MTDQLDTVVVLLAALVLLELRTQLAKHGIGRRRSDDE